MTNRLRLQAKIESGVAILAAALFVLTLISREWIEFLTGWDPDGGSGALDGESWSFWRQSPSASPCAPARTGKR